MSDFPRGYRTEEFKLRMIVDEDSSVLALKDFLTRSIMLAVSHHNSLSVEQLNDALIELTGYFENVEHEDEQQKNK